LEHLGRDFRAAADDERVEVADRLAELLGREAGLRLDVEIGLLAEPSQAFGSEGVGQQHAVAHDATQDRAGRPSARMRSAAPTPRPRSTFVPKCASASSSAAIEVTMSNAST